MEEGHGDFEFSLIDPWINGKEYVSDPIGANDFWWFEKQGETESK